MSTVGAHSKLICIIFVFLLTCDQRYINIINCCRFCLWLLYLYSWPASSWTVSKFISLEWRNKCCVFEFLRFHVLCDWCWPCFYIVTISTSTTKCFSQFPFMRQIINRVAKCMNALNFDISEEAALHSNMHDTGRRSGTLLSNKSTS